MERGRMSRCAVGLLLLATIAPPIAGCVSRPESAPEANASAKAATDAPNVLVWMMDDVGFAQVSSFGGLVPTPNIDRVAESGLRYTSYHTAPICSAARASFLSGRNPHSVHIGGHATAALPAPGYDAHIPPSAGSLARSANATLALKFMTELANAPPS